MRLGGEVAGGRRGQGEGGKRGEGRTEERGDIEGRGEIKASFGADEGTRGRVAYYFLRVGVCVLLGERPPRGPPQSATGGALRLFPDSLLARDRGRGRGRGRSGIRGGGKGRRMTGKREMEEGRAGRAGKGGGNRLREDVEERVGEGRRGERRGGSLERRKKRM